MSRLASDAEGAGALRPAYDLFIKSMGDYDGDSALRIARAMHQRSFAMFDSGEAASTVWSAFCLEGALRRGATDANLDEHFKEASRALKALMGHPRTSRADRLALVQRHAIVAAGFGRRGVEAASLGAALAQGGIDGAQITGLARLQSAPKNGQDDWETAGALFANLLDRARAAGTQDPAQTPGPLPLDPADAPWALRGHGLSVLGSLRASSSDLTSAKPGSR